MLMESRIPLSTSFGERDFYEGSLSLAVWLCYQGPITLHSVLVNELGCFRVLKAHIVKSFLLV